MNKRKACFVLGLDIDNYNEKEIKKQYIKLALKYHPDKNIHGKERFIQIQEAYEYLNNIDGWSSNSKQLSSEKDIPSFESLFDLETISEYMHTLFDMDKETYTFVNSIFKSTYETTHNMIHKLDKEMINRTKRFLSKYASHLYDPKYKSSYETTSESENNHFLKPVITIHPSITDLLNGNIRVIEYENESYYVPLWYTEVEYDSIIVEIIPKLENNIFIDDDNNLTVFIYLDESTIFKRKVFDVVIGNREYNIPTEVLYIRNHQTLDITSVNPEWKGIPLISNNNETEKNKDDIFSISDYGNITIHITIE